MTTANVALLVHDKAQMDLAHRIWHAIHQPAANLADGGPIDLQIQGITAANDALLTTDRNKVALQAERAATRIAN